MKKKALWIVLVVLLLVCLSVSVFAIQKDLSVVIDNQKVQFTTDSGKPFVDENGRTQVPLRVVMEQYGCHVEWDNANRTAILTKDGKTVVVPVGKAYIIVDGMTVPMDTSALLQDGRIYLPIRSVLEAFGAEVAWNNGEVFVASPANNNFESIYVDNNGNVIYELANGNRINVGSLPRGKDGRDGVSVTNAYVDGNGNLMIELSNGKTINAGNIGVGGNMNGLTFADYASGTKFYLTQPTGAFDVTLKTKEGKEYDVFFASIYYELTKKNNANNTDAWKHVDRSNEVGTYKHENYSTSYVPYETTVYISGSTSAELAGYRIDVTLYDVEGSQRWFYSGTIANDGAFAIALTQGVDNESSAWYQPKMLYLESVAVSMSETTQTPTPVVPTVDELLEKVVGTWQMPNELEKIITIESDGRIIENGKEFTPTYSLRYNELLSASYDNKRVDFVPNGNCLTLEIYDMSSPGYNYSKCVYFKPGTWETINITKENFFDYYEYQEVFQIDYNAFGECSAMARGYYKLKEKYMKKLLTTSTLAIKVQTDSYRMEYVLDEENECYTLVEPGELIYSYEERIINGFSEFDLFYTSHMSEDETSTTFYKHTLSDAIGELYIKE